MDQCDAQSGADHGQLLRAVARAEVHIQAPGDAPALNRLPKHLQERRRVLREHECAVRDKPGRVVQDGEQIRLPHAPALVAHRRSVHHVRLPEIAGIRKRPAPLVLLRPLLLPHHQPLTREQPVQRRGRQRDILRHRIRLPRLPDHLPDAQLGGLPLDRQHRIDHIRRHPPRLRPVAAAFRQQPIEAPRTIQSKPVVDRPFGDPHPAAARDVPHLRRLHTDQRSRPVRRLVQHRCQDLEPEQRYRPPMLFQRVTHRGAPFSLLASRTLRGP